MIKINNEDITDKVSPRQVQAIQQAVVSKIQDWVFIYGGYPDKPRNGGFFLLDSLTRNRGTEVNFSFGLRTDELTGQPELAVTIHYLRLAENADEVDQIKNEMSSAPNFKLHPNPHLN